jgi:hypothetical protein
MLTINSPTQASAIQVELAPVRWGEDGSFGAEFIIRRRLAGSLLCQETVDCVVIDHPHRLHECIDNRTSNETKASFLEIL